MINMVKKLTHIFNNRASRWGGGIGLLWRGNTYKNYINSFSTKSSKHLYDLNNENFFFFESCRVAIYHFSKFIGLGQKDNVIIAGFTCDAVTKAIEAVGCDITLYDCGDNLMCESIKTKSNTKLVICQVTFGVQSISDEQLSQLRNKGIHILFDKALSYGSNNFKTNHGGDLCEVMSFELSKSFTIGWGGLIKIGSPTMRNEFRNYYSNLTRVNYINDHLRYYLTLTNLYFTQRGNFIFYLLWLLLRLFNLHRKSSTSSLNKSRIYSRLGLKSEIILMNSIKKIPDLLKLSNSNHEIIKKALLDNGFTVISSVGENCSSPRVVFYNINYSKEELISHFNNYQIELGTWYDEVPIINYDRNNQILPKTRSLMAKVLNIPCHWTMSNEEINKICKTIKFLGNNKSAEDY